VYTRRELAQALGVKPATVSVLVRHHRLAATGKGKARRYPRETAAALLARLDRGTGAKTINLYLAAVKQFCAWMVQDRRADKSPLQHLPFLNTQTDVRHARRALSVEELTRILDAALGSEKIFRGLAGRDRHALYLAAMSTGFRASELGALRPRCFELDAVPALITLPAEHTKNKQPVAQPVAADVALALADYLAGRPDNQPAWPGTWPEKAAEMLRIDLDAAAVAYVTEGPNGPEHADFHALRHSYITNVVNSGVNVKVAQRLARHASVRLTLDRYSHVQLHEQAAAVENLPALLPPGGRPTTAAAG
jgi:integrase